MEFRDPDLAALRRGDEIVDVAVERGDVVLHAAGAAGAAVPVAGDEIAVGEGLVGSFFRLFLREGRREVEKAGGLTLDKSPHHYTDPETA